MKYQFFVRFPFGGHIHDIDAESLNDAVSIVRKRYNVKNERARSMYIITSCFQDGDKVITEKNLFD